jgi:hypothetical protein
MPAERSSASSPRLTWESTGQYDAGEWIDEGDNLLASSKALRSIWLLKLKKRRSRPWSHFVGPPKSAMLLLGYAVEMYLKSALTKAYIGCSEEMFDRDVRHRFGHDLVELASEILFPLSDRDKHDLNTLRQMVLYGARYPLKAKPNSNYTHQKAEVLWPAVNRSEITRMRLMAVRIKKHAKRIDGVGNDSAHFQHHRIDEDGYIAFRCGGGLPPRISYKVSTKQCALGEASMEHVRKLVERDLLYLPCRFWSHSLIQEDCTCSDGKSRTVVRQRLPDAWPTINDIYAADGL